MRKQGCCFLCLRKAGHLARDCDASIKCFRCREHHHVALCEKNLSFRSDSKEKSEATSTQEKKLQRHKQLRFVGGTLETKSKIPEYYYKLHLFLQGMRTILVKIQDFELFEIPDHKELISQRDD